MFEEIKNCTRCELCKNQKPVVDTQTECQIVWVGLSAKMKSNGFDTPLSPKTRSGEMIRKIEDVSAGIKTYKTNLVKCVPLTKNHKLRYPNKTEIDKCIGNLMIEINVLRPKIVFLLGEQVSNSVGAYFSISFEKKKDFNCHFTKIGETYYVPIYHPSYVYVYKRSSVNQYISQINEVIRQLL